ncbi:apolipoprotein N-acyltransferase [Kutzneria viridogrisea]|uniref:Apolipoprotein N-acyltransferase n=1 Tax=Kutzneria viridogrisea TaxID=47990 RepID=A0ABR6BCN0_9PSEU|nr:apolipoprotein N-acyltransferase [Kutzneria viridogrisea]
MVAPAVTPEHPGPEPVPSTHRRRPWPVLARVLVAAAAGGLWYVSYPPRTAWWLAPVAFALLAAVLRHRRARAGFGYGLVFGLAFVLPLLSWLQDFLGADFGPLPWAGLSLVVALYMAVSGAAMAVVSTLRGGPVWMAALFIAGEVLRTRWPLNGFPWGKVGYGQPEGAFLPLAALGGTALLGLAVVLTGTGLAELVARLRARAGRRALIAPLVFTLAPVLAGLAAAPLVTTDAQNGTRTVVIVQGNAPNDGMNLLYDTPILRANHLAATRTLIADIKAGKIAKPDLVVWPETVVDLPPDSARDSELADLVHQLGVPLLVGARHYLNPTTVQNTVQVWDPVTGPGPSYAKQELVPFAEYVPLRSISAAVTPFVADTRDMIPGSGPGALPTTGTVVGAAICYEIAYEQVVSETVAAGAQLLLVPTNNAWYGPGEMSYQQLAMSRVSAVEFGRAVAVAATSGVSAVVEPDGSVSQQTSLFTAQTLVARVPLRSTATLATRLGAWPEWVVSALGLAALVLATGTRIARRRARTGRA